jgi:hypothetical protein
MLTSWTTQFDKDVVKLQGTVSTKHHHLWGQCKYTQHRDNRVLQKRCVTSAHVDTK